MPSTLTDHQKTPYVFPPDHVLSSSATEKRANGRSQTFLQALSGTMHIPKQDGTTTSTCASSTYIHPLARKLSAKLSEKSLEMCTESRGSETGSDDMDDPMINSLTTFHREKEIKTVAKTKREYKYNFPPPLMSIDDSISMKSYRENGRLVMHAVVLTETSGSMFHAERINGRLTLRLKKECLEEGEKNEEFGVEEEDDEKMEEQEAGDGDLIGDIKTMEGDIRIDENMSRFGRCDEAGGERREEGHLWNMETCWVAA